MVRWVCTAYIEIFRSVPTLLLVYVFLFALPGLGVNLSIFLKLTVPIILVNAAVIAEIVRAGIGSLDRGQTEAALAVGMTSGLAMRVVILPQAIRLVVPSLVTQLVALLKDSTLGYVVSFPELMKQANTLANNTKLLLQAFVVVSAIYVLINFALTRLATWLESRIRGGTRAHGRPGRPGRRSRSAARGTRGAALRPAGGGRAPLAARALSWSKGAPELRTESSGDMRGYRDVEAGVAQSSSWRPARSGRNQAETIASAEGGGKDDEDTGGADGPAQRKHEQRSEDRGEPPEGGGAAGAGGPQTRRIDLGVTAYSAPQAPRLKKDRAAPATRIVGTLELSPKADGGHRGAGQEGDQGRPATPPLDQHGRDRVARQLGDGDDQGVLEGLHQPEAVGHQQASGAR